MISYYYNKSTDIVYAELSGEITFDELLNHVSINEQTKEFPSNMKLLTDATNAKLHITPSELELIKNQLVLTLDELEYLKDAFVVINPKETAITTLYMRLAKIKNYEFKVFSTIEAAEYWLNQ
jgi:hypothetical protein